MPNGNTLLGIPLWDIRAQRQRQALTKAQTQLAQTQAIKNLAQSQALQRTAPPADPFTKADTDQLLKDMTGVNANAADAKENDIPLYTQLKAALGHVPLGTGPLTGQLLWATPEGQFFKSLLTRAQGAYIKNFHLGRMTQREFDLLRSAVGGKITFNKALNKIFDRQLGQYNQVLTKAHFYNQYIGSGGRSSIEASNRWLKHLGQTQQPTPEPTTQKPTSTETGQQFFSSKLKRNVSLTDIQDTANIHKTTVDDIKKQLGIK